MRNLFTDEQILELEKNRYTRSVSPSTIKFTEEFRNDFWRLYLTEIPIRDIFRSFGYDPNILGTKRVEGFVYNLRKEFLTDKQRYESQARTLKLKRPPADVKYSEMKSLDAIRAMEAELTYLRQEVDFLKKLYATVPPVSKEA